MTLIEVMVASVIALIVVTSATSLAAGLMRATTRTRAQANVSTRQAMIHGFLERTIDSVGFLWDVTQVVSGGDTGAWGNGYCAPNTGLCPSASKEILPLAICSSTNLEAAGSCDPPSTGAPDGLKAIVPRDQVLEMVSITGEAGAPLPASCGVLGAPANFDVVGVTTEAWEADDLVLIVKRNHVTLARLAAPFAADTTLPPVARTVSVDIGTNTDLVLDDGGRTTGGCDASDRLHKANLFRVKQVMFRVRDQELQLAEVATSNQAASPTWIPLVQGIDDMQFRLDIMAVPQSGTAFTCQCEVSSVLGGVTFAAGTCPSCSGGARLNADSAAADVYRIVGLQIGVMLHAGPELETAAGAATAYAGLFDRGTVTVANDTKLRRSAVYYVGLRNAAAF